MELLVMVSIDGRKCALRALDVDSVMEVDAITPVPQAPDHILGLCTKRSHTLTVIDCLRAAGVEGQAEPIGKRAAVVQHEGHAYALLVDEINDVEDTASEVREVSGGFGDGWADLAEGMVETKAGPALLLSIGRLVDRKGELRRAA